MGKTGICLKTSLYAVSRKVIILISNANGINQKKRSSMSEEKISTIEKFISKVREDCKNWKSFPWFRGEPASETPLVPKLYRTEKGRDPNYENQLLQFFRMKSQSPEFGHTPERGYTDQWLFLARHAGLLTRLLDWTEGSLVALYFALTEQEEENKKKEKGEKGNPIVWMLHPTKLNNLVTKELKPTVSYEDNEFPLTWFRPVLESTFVNIAEINIRAAWEKGRVGTKLPVAIHPTNIHPRMSVQRSCFTIHGKKKESLKKLLDEVDFKYLNRYLIDGGKSKEMLENLRMLGISHATLFPDLDGLAKDLARVF